MVDLDVNPLELSPVSLSYPLKLAEKAEAELAIPPGALSLRVSLHAVGLCSSLAGAEDARLRFGSAYEDMLAPRLLPRPRCQRVR